MALAVAGSARKASEAGSKGDSRLGTSTPLLAQEDSITATESLMSFASCESVVEGMMLTGGFSDDERGMVMKEPSNA